MQLTPRHTAQFWRRRVRSIRRVRILGLKSAGGSATNVQITFAAAIVVALQPENAGGPRSFGLAAGLAHAAGTEEDDYCSKQENAEGDADANAGFGAGAEVRIRG